MVLRPRRRRRVDWLVVAGVLALVGVVLVWLGLSAAAGVDVVQLQLPDPGTGRSIVDGPSVADASPREGRLVAAIGGASLVAAVVSLALFGRR